MIEQQKPCNLKYKRKNGGENGVSVTADNTKCPNIHVNGVLEGKQGEKGAEKHYW